MSLETSMGALAYAKKLRAHQKKLKDKHARDLRSYAVAFESWKKSLEKWLKTGAVENARKLTRGSLNGLRFRDDSWSNAILRGHPTQPTKPNTEAIDRISGVLRHLAITGQKSVRVSSSDIDRYFGEDESEE